MSGTRLTGRENCAGIKRVEGKPAPRYCFVCGLGPCQYGYTKILQQSQQQGTGMPGQEPQHAHELSDTDEPGKKHTMHFDVVSGQTGLWFVTSKQWPGLLASGDTVVDALSNAADAILSLSLAHALEGNSNHPPYKPEDNT